MQIPIDSVADLGLAIRAVRRSSKVRLDDLAGTAKVSKQFLSDVEYGKATVQMGLVFKLLAEIGVSLKLELPQQAGPELTALLPPGPAVRKRFASQRAAAAAWTGWLPRG